MNDQRIDFQIKQLVTTALDYQQAVELIETSRQLFQAKLFVLRKRISNEPQPEKVEKLLVEVNNLYAEYRRSLELIEKSLDSA